MACLNHRTHSIYIVWCNEHNNIQKTNTSSIDDIDDGVKWNKKIYIGFYFSSFKSFYS